MTIRNVALSRFDSIAAFAEAMGWKPYEMRENVSQADYAKLAEGAESGKCSHYMTDEEAKDWICSEFDFDRSKITIIHEVDD